MGKADPVSFIFILLMLGIFYFFIIYPAQKKQREHMELIKNLKKGDKVVTTGGIHGEIVELKEDTVKIKVAPKTEIVVDRVAVARLKKEREK